MAQILYFSLLLLLRPNSIKTWQDCCIHVDSHYLSHRNLAHSLRNITWIRALTLSLVSFCADSSCCLPPAGVSTTHQMALLAWKTFTLSVRMWRLQRQAFVSSTPLWRWPGGSAVSTVISQRARLAAASWTVPWPPVVVSVSPLKHNGFVWTVAFKPECSLRNKLLGALPLFLLSFIWTSTGTNMHFKHKGQHLERKGTF